MLGAFAHASKGPLAQMTVTYSRSQHATARSRHAELLLLCARIGFSPQG